MLGDPLPVERLTAPTDRLRCERLRAVLSVRSCAQQHTFAPSGSTCVSCPVGADRETLSALACEGRLSVMEYGRLLALDRRRAEIERRREEQDA